MTKRLLRWFSVSALIFGLLTTGALAAPEAARKKPALSVMTALPLFWGEGRPTDILNGKSKRAALLQSLDKHYTILPLDVAGEAELASVKLLIAAQPPALNPEELVAIDAWVRAGGRSLIFADPHLLWPSIHPTGDRRRAPRASLLGPLLGHWGLQLLRPAKDDLGVSIARIAGMPVAVAAPGQWKSASSDCKITAKGLIATCALGRGRVILVADADLLDERLWRETNSSNYAAIEHLITLLLVEQ